MRRQLLGCFDFAIALLILVLVSAPHFMPVASAQTATPPSSTISSSINSSSGPLAWDFGPVGGGTFINVVIQNICPPGNHEESSRLAKSKMATSAAIARLHPLNTAASSQRKQLLAR